MIFGSLILLAKHILNQIYVHLVAAVLPWLWHYSNLSAEMAFHVVCLKSLRYPGYIT